MKPWIVVASAARARGFEVAGRGAPWREMWDLVNTEERLARQDLVTDRPGRGIDRAGGQRHTFDSRADPREQAADRFSRQLAGELEGALQDRRFERLYLVAAPRFLGLLRRHMSPALNEAIAETVPKDLTAESARSLQAHVAQCL